MAHDNQSIVFNCVTKLIFGNERSYNDLSFLSIKTVIESNIKDKSLKNESVIYNHPYLVLQTVKFI